MNVLHRLQGQIRRYKNQETLVGIFGRIIHGELRTAQGTLPLLLLPMWTKGSGGLLTDRMLSVETGADRPDIATGM